MLESMQNAKKGPKKWKSPTLKGKSKIKEWECLSSLGNAKEVSIKERNNKCQKSTPRKNTELQT